MDGALVTGSRLEVWAGLNVRRQAEEQNEEGWGQGHTGRARSGLKQGQSRWEPEGGPCSHLGAGVGFRRSCRAGEGL